MDQKQTVTIKCSACNKPIKAEITEGQIEARCKNRNCGVLHTGSAAAWGSIRTDAVRLMAPASLYKRISIGLK